MILAQGILDELRHQAELQGKKNYRCIEVDWRTIIAMCDEIEESRKLQPAIGSCVVAKDTNPTNPEFFSRGDRVLFSGKEYGFLAYDDRSCFLYPLDQDSEGRCFTANVCDVKKAPL